MTRGRAAAGLAVWAVLTGSLAATGARPAALVLLGLAAVAVVAGSLVVDLGRDVARTTWSRGTSVRARRTQDRRVASLRRQLATVHGGGAEDVRELLCALVDDRLLAHHGVDRSQAPEAAAPLLTPSLQRLMAGDAAPPSGVRELDRLLTDIEAL